MTSECRPDINTFQGLILALQNYWANHGCVVMQPLDMEVGAGTFHPATFLRAIGPEKWNAAYVQPCRRPTDGRYGENPNRLQHYYQFQVVMKPSPKNIQSLYIHSLRELGIDPLEHDIRFVEDNWESPTLGAWGLGWEVWMNGMEITQFTYFQQAGGLSCFPVTGEITYGLERLAMYIQGVDSVYDLVWTFDPEGRAVTYGDVFHQQEVEMSTFNFEHADTEELFRQFTFFEQESARLIEQSLPLPAYEYVLKASHVFNLLDARHAISVTERQRYILRVRTLAKSVATAYLNAREARGFPLADQTIRDAIDGDDDTQKVVSNGSKQNNESNQPHQDLLIELGTEELPPKALKKLCQSFSASVTEGLSALKLSFETVESFATPRRLAILIKSVETKQPDREIERRGPALNAAFDDSGNPTRAAEGFARSNNVAINQLERLKTDKGEWLVFRTTEVGKPIASLVPELIATAVNQLPIPKKMRWGGAEVQDRFYEFVRPVHWLLVMLDKQPIDCEVMGVRSGNQTWGHRFHSETPITLPHASQYRELLETQGWVIACFEQRRRSIETQVTALATSLGGSAVIDTDLLDEVTALNEWPVAISGHFDPSFLTVPPEVLVSSMREHQKYFHVLSQDGTLLPHFITVSNIDSSAPESVVSGNERVIKPRLADAKFFFETDKKTALGKRRKTLENVVFQNVLGSVYDKTERIAKLAKQIACVLNADEQLVHRAALLSKSDLTTDMVQEFPELQGVMGRYYGKSDGEADAVSQALGDQYLPRFSGDALPEGVIGCALSIADRIDTITGIFGINQPPTGSKDPFALRRATLGALRIMVEKELPLDLKPLIQLAIEGYASQQVTFGESNELLQTVLDFMLERFRSWYQDQGYATEVFLSVRALGHSSPLDFARRVEAVHRFSQLSEAEALASANKRVSNLLDKADDDIPETINTSLLIESYEQQLFNKLLILEKETDSHLEKTRYSEALEGLSSLKEPVDNFFDNVLINDENDSIRINRYAVLRQLRAQFLRIADISMLQNKR